MIKPHSMAVCGATKIGERGQVVIPAEVRRQMNLKNGDHLLVFCRPDHFVGLMKADKLDGILADIAKQTDKLKKIKKDLR